MSDSREVVTISRLRCCRLQPARRRPAVCTRMSTPFLPWLLALANPDFTSSGVDTGLPATSRMTSPAVRPALSHLASKGSHAALRQFVNPLDSLDPLCARKQVIGSKNG